MPTTNAHPFWKYPVVVCGVVMATVFAAEYTVMLLLPVMLPVTTPRIIVAAVDSIILVAVVAPVLWRTVVHPLQEVIRLRSRFLTDLFRRIEADRKRTAYELHDGIGQSLSLLVSGLRTVNQAPIDAETAARCQRLLHLAETALQDTKRLALGLRPGLLDDLGLAPALDRIVSDVREHQGIEVTLEVGDVEGVRLSEEVETAVFRIVQEALANAVRHGCPRSASVAVRRSREGVVVEVADDGQGFEMNGRSALAPGHLGLKGMQERTTLLGGQFTIDSAPGRGTRISAFIRTKEEEHDQNTAAAGR